MNETAKIINLEMSIEEANLVLEALGQQPFVKVYGLIAKIQEQAKRQFGGETIEPEAADTAPSPLPNIDG